MYKTLIIGYGQIGKALTEVLEDYMPDILDSSYPSTNLEEEYDIIHICFPYSKDFVDEVKKIPKPI